MRRSRAVLNLRAKLVPAFNARAEQCVYSRKVALAKNRRLSDSRIFFRHIAESTVQVCKDVLQAPELALTVKRAYTQLTKLFRGFFSRRLQCEYDVSELCTALRAFDTVIRKQSEGLCKLFRAALYRLTRRTDSEYGIAELLDRCV